MVKDLRPNKSYDEELIYEFKGLILGLVIPFILSFILGIGLPIVLNYELFLPDSNIVVLLMVTGSFQIMIFIALAFLISFFNDDKLKGLGISIFCGFFLLLYTMV